jgi:SHS2 domain-containing protein
MKNYEILEHTADLKIKVFGRTKEELFLNAVLALVDCLKPATKSLWQKIYHRRFFATAKRKLKISSSDLETLLVDFLSEVLYLIQTNKEVYDEVKFDKLLDNELEAELSGKKAESFGEDIKGVTYHSLKIEQKPDKTWEAIILFDI